MKAISLWQPWATLIVLGDKHYETRSWYTGYRGPLAIHAAKRPLDRNTRELMNTAHFRASLEGHDLPFGAIVGTVELVDCRRIWLGIKPTDVTSRERAFGNWEAGRFAWQLANPVRFKDPIPCVGQQGFFEVPDRVRLAVAA